MKGDIRTSQAVPTPLTVHPTPNLMPLSFNQIYVHIAIFDVVHTQDLPYELPLTELTGCQVPWLLSMGSRPPLTVKSVAMI